jgi:hypothetical protein
MIALLALGCSASVDENPTPPAPECPVVECAFLHGSCDARTNTYRERTTQFSEGCWVTTAACFPIDTPEGCEPADCYVETSLACD